MAKRFFDQPILNSPYEKPTQHWELDEQGQPTERIIAERRKASYVTPIPKSQRQRRKAANQLEIGDLASSESATEEAYDPTPVINRVRQFVDTWRALPSPSQWGVTPETERLLQHWRHYPFAGIRPFFCQVEAIETLIWLTEVAPKTTEGKAVLQQLQLANEAANGGMARLALKLATGAGKTTVMAMTIAWQTINAVRRPNSKLFTKGFLVVAPGLTIKDRLRVLFPNDTDSYYANRELVPRDMLPELGKAKIVVTNYHAFMLREKLQVAKGTRQLIQGRTGDELQTKETEGEMIRRVMNELMGMRHIMVLNDEAHHCYRTKPGISEDDEDQLKGDEKKEAKRNNEEARVWFRGLEIVDRLLKINRVVDLSATPFFLRGSGYKEGSLFQWTMSDFSLMDAIECGIVKLPRVPIAENVPGNELPTYRELWEHIRKDMPKKRRGETHLDPQQLPIKLISALEALYGHYEKTYKAWMEAGKKVPPCFIIVCQNTSISKLIYDYISGYHYTDASGDEHFQAGTRELFLNYDAQTGDALPRPNTLLVDSMQLESGEALDATFKKIAEPEIERFRRERIERGEARAGEDPSDTEILREVMNTVGKEGTLGGHIRCVVSVSMLTEGWDANTVTHILGVRAFGTQLLCEQVVGRALRRQSYALNAQGLFDVEYADIFGIPFDFTAEPTVAPIKPPPVQTLVKAVKPERDALAIAFPRVDGYRVDMPGMKLEASFNEDSTFELTPELVGPTITKNAGIIGESVEMNVEHLANFRPNTILFNLTTHLLRYKFRDANEEVNMNLFPQLKPIVRYWLQHHLICKGDTYPAMLCYTSVADKACSYITEGILRHNLGSGKIKALLNPYTPIGSSDDVHFFTANTELWETHPDRCQINYVVLDSDWEAEFCRVAERHHKVLGYVKNHAMGFEVPYRFKGDKRIYRPDFIVLVDDGAGFEDPLHLVVEIKGYRGEDAKEKKATMETQWVPGVNYLKRLGRWAFAEFRDVYAMQEDFEQVVERHFEAMLEAGMAQAPAPHTVKARV